VIVELGRVDRGVPAPQHPNHPALVMEDEQIE